MSERSLQPVPGVLGVILAGGRSSRMGGGDKGLAELGGRPMLAHVVERLQTQVNRLVLSANGPAERFSQFQLPIVADLDALQRGPMAGLFAAMTWALANAPDTMAIATATSDVPFLPRDVVAQLHAAAAFGPAIAVSNGRRHPTIALWPMRLLSAVREALAADQLSLNVFAARNSAVEVRFAFSQSGDLSIDPFFNANTPTELEDARAFVQRSA